MADWFVAPALEQLRDDVNEAFPNRDKASDGAVGDTSHAARKSDHNPDYDAPGRSRGIVRAIDIDISPDGRADADLRTMVLQAAIGDPRVWYVISNGIIYSRTSSWVPRAYTGSNPHDKHVHVSLNGANGVPGDPGNFDRSPWLVTPDPPAPPPRASLGAVFDHAIEDVRRSLRWHRRKGHKRVVARLTRNLAQLKATRQDFPRK